MKVVITLLGLISHQKPVHVSIVNGEVKYDYKDKEEDDKAEYLIDNNVNLSIKNMRYINMLDVLVKNVENDIIAIGTSKAIKIQNQVLEYENIDLNRVKFIEIEDEKNYENILNLIDEIMNNYQEVIFDVSHGFRHIPILSIIDLIIQNIKNPHKIKYILFAKEETPNVKYEIIDLKEYLELSNLSFIVTNFQDNYTISKHLIIQNNRYKSLIQKMNIFSSDLMALSLEHLLENSVKELINEIEEIEKEFNSTKEGILIDKLVQLNGHLKTIFYKKTHRYETYFYLAQDLFKKGYLVHTISLLFEGIGFYAKSSFEKYDEDLKEYIHLLETEIKSDKRYKTIRDYYSLTSACRSYLSYDKDRNNDKLFKEFSDIIYSNISVRREFKNFIVKLNNIRNNLLHSNASLKINAIESKVKKLLNDFEKFCIKEDILQKKDMFEKLSAKFNNRVKR